MRNRLIAALEALRKARTIKNYSYAFSEEKHNSRSGEIALELEIDGFDVYKHKMLYNPETQRSVRVKDVMEQDMEAMLLRVGIMGLLVKSKENAETEV